MSQSASFQTSGLSLASIVQLSSNTLKISYTFDPLAVSASNSNDALNPNNYSLSGPIAAYIESVEVVGGDSLSFFLITNTPLAGGNWSITVLNVQTASGSNLVDPKTLDFIAAPLNTLVSANPGAINDDTESIIKKHLNPFLKGPGLDALIAGLANGDSYVLDTAQAAFDQLFLSSASGKYLERISSDYGLDKPDNLGLSDELFRELTIKINAEKLTLNSFLSILETYYGEDALRASVDSITEPYSLSEGDNLIVKVDNQLIEIIFNLNDFSLITQATAEEVSSKITRIFELNNINAYAKPVLDVNSQKNFIRIYSGALGIRGVINVSGGKAQNILNFPTKLNTTQDATTQWQVTRSATDKTRFTYNGGTNPTLNLVRVNDYVNIFGNTFNINNRGTFTITDVTDTYFEIVNIKGVSQSVTQSSISDILFFRPTIFTINSKQRISIVSSTDYNQVEITLPATTQIVERKEGTGAYLNKNNTLSIVPAITINSGGISRSTNVVTVTASTQHNLRVGDTVYLSPGESSFPEGIKTIGSVPNFTTFTYNENGSNTTSTKKQYISPNYKISETVHLTTSTDHSLAIGDQVIVDNLVPLQNIQSNLGFNLNSTTSENKDFGAHCLLSNDLILSVGGNSTNLYLFNKDGTINFTTTLPYTFYKGTVTKLPDGKALIVDGNTVNTPRALIFDPNTKSLVETAPPSQKRQGHSATVLKDGRILVSGGVDFSGTTVSSAEIFDPASFSWSTTANTMNSARAYHESTLLRDGRVLVSGGYVSSGTPSIALCDIYNPHNNQWMAVGNLNTARHSHTAISLDIGVSGKVLVIGGTSNDSLSTTWLSSCELFDVSTLAWSTSISLNSTKYPNGVGRHAVALTYNKKVLISGGWNGTSNINTAAIFDPLKNIWSDSFSNLNTARSTHKMFILSDDSIFVTPGTSANTTENYVDDNNVVSSGKINQIFSVSAVSSTNSFEYLIVDSTDKSILTTLDTADTNIVTFKGLDNINTIGPYLYDPLEFSPQITNISTTTSVIINQGQSISLLSVNDTTNFPNTGYLCFALGTDIETFPVKYLEVISPTQILLDSSFIFPNNIPANSSVIYSPNKNSFEPSSMELTGSFYLTDSSIGRISAENTIENISACGANLNTQVVYPNSRGLGGEDVPVDSDGPKLNDSIYIWGYDSDVTNKRGY